MTTMTHEQEAQAKAKAATMTPADAMGKQWLQVGEQGKRMFALLAAAVENRPDPKEVAQYAKWRNIIKQIVESSNALAENIAEMLLIDEGLFGADKAAAELTDPNVPSDVVAKPADDTAIVQQNGVSVSTPVEHAPAAVQSLNVAG